MPKFKVSITWTKVVDADEEYDAVEKGIEAWTDSNGEQSNHFKAVKV
jgi:hypothetical protein